MKIRRVVPKEADLLTQIALSAKRHWGYPESWVEIWTPQLTFSPEYFQENESWVAEINNIPIGFYTLQEKDGIAQIENLWVLPEYWAGNWQAVISPCNGTGASTWIQDPATRSRSERGRFL